MSVPPFHRSTLPEPPDLENPGSPDRLSQDGSFHGASIQNVTREEGEFYNHVPRVRGERPIGFFSSISNTVSSVWRQVIRPIVFGESSSSSVVPTDEQSVISQEDSQVSEARHRENALREDAPVEPSNNSRIENSASTAMGSPPFLFPGHGEEHMIEGRTNYDPINLQEKSETTANTLDRLIKLLFPEELLSQEETATLNLGAKLALDQLNYCRQYLNECLLNPRMQDRNKKIALIDRAAHSLYWAGEDAKKYIDKLQEYRCSHVTTAEVSPVPFAVEAEPLEEASLTQSNSSLLRGLPAAQEIRGNYR